MTLRLNIFEDSVQVKLDRAAENLEALNAAVLDAFTGDAAITMMTLNSDATEATFDLHFRQPSPIRRWRAIAGDVFNNLRSALDHMLYAIAVSHQQKDPPEGGSYLNFPISDLAENFRSLPHLKRLIAPAALAIIEEEQPFNKPIGAMTFLREATNHDKHRTVLGIAAAPHEFKITSMEAPNGGNCHAHFVHAPLVNWEDGTPHYILKLKFDNPQPGLKVNVEFTFMIVLYFRGEWRDILEVAPECRDDVVRIIERLKPHLV